VRRGAGVKPSAILRAARGRIVAGWCKGAQARNRDGAPVYASDADAVCFCMAGAVIADSGGVRFQSLARVYFDALDYLSAEVDETILKFNDAQASRWPVVAAFNRAIARAEQDERAQEAAA
jgi:hypothetical protein